MLIHTRRFALRDFLETDRAAFISYQMDPRYRRLYDFGSFDDLAPNDWGRYRLAIEVVSALLEHGFFNLNLHTIVGSTASGNRRVERLARWFGANIIEQRAGPQWMEARRRKEVDWALARGDWAMSEQRRSLFTDVDHHVECEDGKTTLSSSP